MVAVRLPILFVISWMGKSEFLCQSPFAPENFLARNRFGRRLVQRPTPRPFSTPSRPNLVLTDGLLSSSRCLRGCGVVWCVHLNRQPPSGNTIDGLEFIRQRNCVPMAFAVIGGHRASGPQDGSTNGCCLFSGNPVGSNNECPCQ